MEKDVADKVRGMVRRATIRNVKDDGQTQTASVEVADGVWRDDIEIMHPYGMAANPPEDGALVLLLAVAGDEGDLVALPAGNPSRRMGKLNPGDSGLYNEAGDKVIVRRDGVIEIAAGASVQVVVGGVSFTVSPAGVDIEGGYVRHNGKDIGDTHKHGGVTPGGALTDVPA
ncbi:phage baseplate assembly protein domain-containing protein [Hoeflea sp.]|uniref:phage baseplate assembly protein domain-containing protein n=1 Tax=Hoeflea sp. TaxID=1940281 RepID=UPI003A8F913B